MLEVALPGAPRPLLGETVEVANAVVWFVTATNPGCQRPDFDMDGPINLTGDVAKNTGKTGLTCT